MLRISSFSRARMLQYRSLKSFNSSQFRQFQESTQTTPTMLRKEGRISTFIRRISLPSIHNTIVIIDSILDEELESEKMPIRPITQKLPLHNYRAGKLREFNTPIGTHINKGSAIWGKRLIRYQRNLLNRQYEGRRVVGNR